MLTVCRSQAAPSYFSLTKFPLARSLTVAQTLNTRGSISVQKPNKRANLVTVLHVIQHFKENGAKEENSRTQFISSPARSVDCNNNPKAGEKKHRILNYKTPTFIYIVIPANYERKI